MNHPIFKVTSLQILPCDLSLIISTSEQVKWQSARDSSSWTLKILLNSIVPLILTEEDGGWVVGAFECCRKNFWSIFLLWDKFNSMVSQQLVLPDLFNTKLYLVEDCHMLYKCMFWRLLACAINYNDYKVFFSEQVDIYIVDTEILFCSSHVADICNVTNTIQWNADSIIVKSDDFFFDKSSVVLYWEPFFRHIIVPCMHDTLSLHN